MMRPLIAAMGLAVLVSACSGNAALTELAQDTCDELEDAIVLQVGGIVNGAVRDAEDLGYTGPDLGDKMREECPATMEAIESLGDEQERRDNLPDQMHVVLDVCSSVGSNGTVKNNSNVTVDVYIQVQYLDSSGTIIDDGLDSIDRIRPGETATWEDDQFSAITGLDRCRADVSSVFES